jgi:hypothetical protein
LDASSDDHARAGSLLPSLRPVGKVEEVPEEGIAKERVVLERGARDDGNIDHRWRDLVDERRKRRQAARVRLRWRRAGIRRREQDRRQRVHEESDQAGVRLLHSCQRCCGSRPVIDVPDRSKTGPGEIAVVDRQTGFARTFNRLSRGLCPMSYPGDSACRNSGSGTGPTN